MFHFNKQFQLLLISLITLPTGMQIFAHESIQPKVIVIGGGLAGLTTAYRLNALGADVELYEAKGRVGGRVLSVVVNGKINELGGLNILDGGEAKNLRGLINEMHLDIEQGQRSDTLSFITEDSQINFRDLLKTYPFDRNTIQAELESIAKNSLNMAEVLDTLLKEKNLLYQTLCMRLAAYEGGTVDVLSPLYTETLYYMLLGGLSIAHQRQNNKISHSWVKGGNSRLPETLANSLGEKIHLNMPLQSVVKNLDGIYQLTFRNGKKMIADILVLAIPCTVYDRINFEADIIPQNILTAIQKIQYGTNAKILVPFAQKYEKNLHYMHPHVITFFNSTRDTLILYYSGKEGCFTPKTIQETYQQDRPLFEKGYKIPDLANQQPIYARDEAFAVYKSPVGYSWANDLDIKGSYSFVACGQEETMTSLREHHGESVRTLFAPLNGDTLYFAGEHTSILLQYSGTMEAACESGERTARMIARQVLND